MNPDTRRGWGATPLYAVGHSTRSLEEMIALLRSVGVRTLADIRTVPRSRTNPQFNRDSFPRPLARAGIAYVHIAELGGLRKPRKDSPNAGWRNRSFRGYADHMRTAEFEAGLRQLKGLLRHGPLAFMCAEALRWRCHRSLVADALVARGANVQHLVAPGRVEAHRMTPFAKRRGRWVLYPPLPDSPAEASAASLV